MSDATQTDTGIDLQGAQPEQQQAWPADLDALCPGLRACVDPGPDREAARATLATRLGQADTDELDPIWDAGVAIAPSDHKHPLRRAVLEELARASGRRRWRQAARSRDLNGKLNGEETYAMVVLPGAERPVWMDSLPHEVVSSSYPRCSTSSAFRASERGGADVVVVWLPVGAVVIDMTCAVSRGQKQRASRVANRLEADGTWTKVPVKSGWTR